MINIIKRIVVVAFAVILVACASGVTRMDGVTSHAQPVIAPKVKSVNLWLNDDAKKLVGENLKFNQDVLRSTIERSLQAQDIIKTDAAQNLDIEITSFRVRSNFTAIMFGFMAGNDNIEGLVSIKDDGGKVLKKAKVNASYALGGIAGGQDDARMGWLYEAFAKHALAEVTGVPVK
jgi:hypothetical protein